MDEVGEAFGRAVFTRRPPISPGAQLNYLLRRAGNDTRKVAEQLGVTPRTVQRYIKGDRRPSPKVAEKMSDQVRSMWQPRVRQRAVKQAGGVMVHTRATFGFDAPAGTTDDPRTRLITQALPGEYARQLAAATDEQQRRDIIAQGLAREYFQDGGTRAGGLNVAFTDIDYIDLTIF